jgi:hypothetical protein
MRAFAQVPPTTWQSEVKKLRGDTDAIAVYFHLLTSQHSSMIGVYADNPDSFSHVMREMLLETARLSIASAARSSVAPAISTGCMVRSQADIGGRKCAALLLACQRSA